MIDKKLEVEHWESEHTMQYHKKQFFEPKRMTVAFEKFLTRNCNFEKSCVLDLGCGGGATDVYFSKLHPELQIHGIDIVEKAFDLFNTYAEDDVKSHVKLMKGDWYNLDKSFIGKYEGVISLQSLSWLEDWKIPVEKICELNPKWMAFSSLFYEGKINYQIRLTDYELKGKNVPYQETYYNIYSIPLVRDFLAEKGYKKFVFEPFEIDIDIPKPASLDAGTYTVKTEEGKRLQISAAMLMPWYFIFASK